MTKIYRKTQQNRYIYNFTSKNSIRLYTMEETISTPQRDIMQYDPQIWAVADLRMAAGIKQSKFPDFMMPFCVLSCPSKTQHLRNLLRNQELRLCR